MQSTSLAAVLNKIATVLEDVTLFLLKVFRLVERVTDVLIKGATSVVKRVVAEVAPGVKEVMRVCQDMAATAFKAAGKGVASAGRAARSLCRWVSGWFNPSQKVWVGSQSAAA